MPGVYGWMSVAVSGVVTSCVLRERCPAFTVQLIGFCSMVVVKTYKINPLLQKSIRHRRNDISILFQKWACIYLIVLCEHSERHATLHKPPDRALAACWR